MMTAARLSNHILVIDDAATTRLILQQGLSNAGFSVTVAKNGYQALLAFQEQRFDLVVMDVNMPVMDGFSCCKALRNTQLGKTIPIIVLTGRDDHESINNAFEAGASDFISKPINLRLLIHRIRFGLREAKREKELLNSHHQLEGLLEELQATQTQLIQSEKLASIGLLAAGIAHEINNPLAIVKSNLTSLKEMIDWLTRLLIRKDNAIHLTPAEQQHLTALIQDTPELFHDSDDGFSRIQRIIHSLLSLSQPQESADVATHVETAITESVNYCLKAQGFAGNLNMDFNAKDAHIAMSKADFLQVINTLVSNSLEATGLDADILIRCHIEGDNCIIELEDNGPGIAEMHLDRIFEPFFSTKPVGKGTGLGLSIVYQLIKKVNGHISASNLKKGGLSMKLEFPLHSVDY